MKCRLWLFVFVLFSFVWVLLVCFFLGFFFFLGGGLVCFYFVCFVCLFYLLIVVFYVSLDGISGNLAKKIVGFTDLS